MEALAAIRRIKRILDSVDYSDHMSVFFALGQINAAVSDILSEANYNGELLTHDDNNFMKNLSDIAADRMRAYLEHLDEKSDK